MKITIHNEQILEGENQYNQVQQTLMREYEWFEKLNKALNSNSLNVFFTENEKGIKATLYLKQNNQQIFVEGEGANPIELIEKLMHRLRSRQLREMIEAKKRSRISIARKHLKKLEELNTLGSQDHFVFLIKELLPSIRRFVARYLQGRNIKLAAGFSIEDLVDEIYLALYKRFNECPKSEDEFSAWSFQIAQETIEDFIEKNHGQEGTVSIENILREDLKSMEERYSTDAEGEPVMLEELDEVERKSSPYGEEILNDAALRELPDEIEIDPVVKDVLSRVNPTEKITFELFWLHQLTEKEIAKALRLQISEVERTIDEITQRIVSQLKSV